MEQLPKDALNKLKHLNDEQLRAAIGDIADALGAPPAQKRRMQNNANLIRRKLLGSSEAELMHHLSRLAPDKQQELLRKLKS